VFPADVAKGAFTKVPVDFAEVVLVQERAAVMREQPEVPVLDIGAELVAESARHLAVRFLRVFVYVDFPAYAAGVAAAVGCAFEFIVKIGLSEDHGGAFYCLVLSNVVLPFRMSFSCTCAVMLLLSFALNIYKNGRAEVACHAT